MPFSFLNSVRELRDGTVLAADPLSQVLLRIDLEAGTADTLGGVGPGPEEYEQPDQVFPLPADSTLLVDLGKTYLTVIDPEGRFTGGRSMLLQTEDRFPELLHPQFVDGEGGIYYRGPSRRSGSPPDSAAVVRFDRSTETLDTIATVWLGAVQLIRTRDFGFLPPMLEPRDGWAVGMDGRVAVLRGEDYSVAWRYPDGRSVRGPSHDFDPLPVTRTDKETILATTRAQGISMTAVASRSGGEVQMTMSRGRPSSGDGPGVDDYQWGETFPAFRPEGTRVSPRGEAWAQRWLPPDSAPRYEVFDGEGARTGSVALPPGRDLMSFGRTSEGTEAVYLVRTDEYDLRWLERYRVIRSR